MIIPWWVYFILASAIFVLFLLGHFIAKTLNEIRLNERLQRLEERTSVSTQVSVIIDKDNKKKESNKNLKEDKRSKSVSLIFNADKKLSLIENNENKKGVKSNSSGDLKAFSSDGSSLNVPLHVKSLPDKLNVHATEVFRKDNQVNNVKEFHISTTEKTEIKPEIDEDFINTHHCGKNSTLLSIINDTNEKCEVQKDNKTSNCLENPDLNWDTSKENTNNNDESLTKTKVSVQDIILSPMRNDNNTSSSFTIQREPSSLFFGAICGTPSTPKEILERYENAFASAKSSKLETKISLFDDNVSGSKYSAATSTSRPKSTIELLNSRENLSTTISKVTFNPETKKSYIENILNEKPISNREISITKLSVTTSKLSQTKDLSKCTSRVTFAKNAEIVIKDSGSSIGNHVCVIASSEVPLTNESETLSEFDLDNRSNLNESKDSVSNTDSKDVRKIPFKRSFIGEIVTVQDSTYKTSNNAITEYTDLTDTHIEDTKISQTSFDSDSKNKSENNILDQIALFNTKLNDRLTVFPIDEPCTSRSNNLIDNPEVIVVNNRKYSEETEQSRTKNENNVTVSETNVDYSNKNNIELDENIFQTASFDRLKCKTTEKGGNEDSKNTKDENEDVGE